MDLAMFCDRWSAMGPPFGHFTLKNAALSCNPPFCGSPLSLTLHPYISACGVDKLSRMARNSASYEL